MIMCKFQLNIHHLRLHYVAFVEGKLWTGECVERC